MTYNVIEYGLSNKGDKLNQKDLQNLIDNIPDDESDAVVYFPKGTYLLSTVFLKGNLTLKFEDGVTILGSNNFYDYEQEEFYDFPRYQDSSHSNFNCSLFVIKDCDNIKFIGPAVIDMNDCWDLDNVREIKHRGPKAITLKSCNNCLFDGITINRCSDLALYFTDCNNVEISHVKMNTYIDGISPDNSKNCYIHDCDIIAGDDGIVLKSSYNLNRLDYCKNIRIENCKISSNCNCIKFGTESNGGFYDVTINDCYFYNTRVTGFSIESVDGAFIENIKINNIIMRNVGTPFFIHLGKRLRGPVGTKIGGMKNITIENVTATGPYEPYEAIIWNHDSFVNREGIHYPWKFGYAESFESASEPDTDWQFTSNICGLIDHDLENITFKNIDLELWGHSQNKINFNVPEDAQDYPEVYVYGAHLPSYGMYFRHINGLTLENVNFKLLNEDNREAIIFTDVKNLKRN